MTKKMNSEKLDRYPYQGPQTPMERHLMELVAHLKDGTDSRAGFADKVEAAQSHAFWLEKHCRELQAEVSRLEKALMPSLPTIKCWSEESAVVRPYDGMVETMCFDWGMEQIRYRAVFNGYDQKDSDVAKRVRRRAYREILGRLRNEFEKTWTLNFSKRRRERAA